MNTRLIGTLLAALTVGACVVHALSPSDARRAKQRGKEYKAKYGQQRPRWTGP